MNVTELITRLQKLDPNTIVVVTTDNFEQGHQEIEAKHVYEYNGDRVRESFTDAFDGGSYTKEVIRFNPAGSLRYVKIG